MYGLCQWQFGSWNEQVTITRGSHVNACNIVAIIAYKFTTQGLINNEMLYNGMLKFVTDMLHMEGAVNEIYDITKQVVDEINLIETWQCLGSPSFCIKYHVGTSELQRFIAKKKIMGTYTYCFSAISFKCARCRGGVFIRHGVVLKVFREGCSCVSSLMAPQRSLFDLRSFEQK